MSIIRYRKLPVEVDTVQWTGTNEHEVQEFTGGAHRFYALDAEDRENSDDPEATATVFDKLHSTWVLVYTGQHIVRGVKGEFYPIAEDVLADTYEAVIEATPDTFPAWLAQRLDRNGAPWDGMSDDDRSYWEHEAAAVRRAVARGGFKTDVTEGEGQ